MIHKCKIKADVEFFFYSLVESIAEVVEYIAVVLVVDITAIVDICCTVVCKGLCCIRFAIGLVIV